jgi:hypothetical protein
MRLVVSTFVLQAHVNCVYLHSVFYQDHAVIGCRAATEDTAQLPHHEVRGPWPIVH